MLGIYQRIDVMEYERALLYERGRFVGVLGAGSYRVWGLWFRQHVVVLDTRLMSLSVAGQEILTADKLPLRLTLIAQYKISDPVAAVNKVQDYCALLYEELQLALRTLVSSMSLDDLFAKKTAIAESLLGQVKPKVAEFGLDLTACDLKDIILPGPIKAILTKVVEAERTAQASLISAREELAATRCQINTAKMVSENPAILRLKELQVLSELARKPGNNTIVLGQPFLESKKF